MLSLTGTALTGLLLAAPPVTTPEFLQEAMAQERGIGRCTAYLQNQHAVELDRSGAIKPGQELHVVRQFTGIPPSQKMSVVSADHAGKDITEEMRKAGRPSEADRFRSPFHPEMRPLYMFVRAPSDPAGPLKLEFRPTYAHRRDAGLFDGTALLDRTTGHVLQWRANLVNPPTLVTRAEVTVTYGLRVGLLEARSQVHVELEGGLLFYKRQGRMDFQFKDYVCPEAMPQPTGPSVSGPADVAPPQQTGQRADLGG